MLMHCLQQVMETYTSTARAAEPFQNFFSQDRYSLCDFLQYLFHSILFMWFASCISGWSVLQLNYLFPLQNVFLGCASSYVDVQDIVITAWCFELLNVVMDYSITSAYKNCTSRDASHYDLGVIITQFGPSLHHYA